jgi:hypothetical protein
MKRTTIITPRPKTVIASISPKVITETARPNAAKNIAQPTTHALFSRKPSSVVSQASAKKEESSASHSKNTHLKPNTFFAEITKTTCAHCKRTEVNKALVGKPRPVWRP